MEWRGRRRLPVGFEGGCCCAGRLCGKLFYYCAAMKGGQEGSRKRDGGRCEASGVNRKRLYTGHGHGHGAMQLSQSSRDSIVNVFVGSSGMACQPCPLNLACQRRLSG